MPRLSQPYGEPPSWRLPRGSGALAASPGGASRPGEPPALLHLHHHLEEPHRRPLPRRRPFNRLPLALQRRRPLHDRPRARHVPLRLRLLKNDPRHMRRTIRPWLHRARSLTITLKNAAPPAGLTTGIVTPSSPARTSGVFAAASFSPSRFPAATMP